MIEEDEIWELPYIKKLSKRQVTIQFSTSWGLTSVSHREAGATDYVYDFNAGEDTFTYVVDSGIRLTNSEFEGRVSLGLMAFPEETEDSTGHGTHDSSIIV